MKRTPRHVAILAGGSGTRFWPAGTASRPKQLLAVDGDDPRPLLLATYERVAPLCDRDGPWVVATKALAKKIGRMLPARARRRFILEPVPRNTAAAIALAAETVEDTTPDTGPPWPPTPLLAIVPADAHVGPDRQYRAALSAMLDRAEANPVIVMLGMRPSFPATGYGYVELGPRLRRLRGVASHAVRSFVEKPSLAVARRYMRGRRHVWNLGTFAADTQDYLKFCHKHFPPLLNAWPDAYQREYASIPPISFDHAVMEKVDPKWLEVVVTDLEWDDLGSWDAVARHAKADAAGNALPRGAVAVDAKRCFARAEDGTVVALLGVEDLVVVRTAKATLVAKRGRGEDVRKVVERLKAAGRGDVVS